MKTTLKLKINMSWEYLGLFIYPQNHSRPPQSRETIPLTYEEATDMSALAPKADRRLIMRLPSRTRLRWWQWRPLQIPRRRTWRLQPALQQAEREVQKDTPEEGCPPAEKDDQHLPLSLQIRGESQEVCRAMLLAGQ
jgi:hypothetical protein